MRPSTRLLGLLALGLAGCTNALVDDVPRLYACDRAEGLDSCPGGWRCGLAGFCQDPAQALPYACVTSEDCSATWHCGGERLCYDRAVAQDRSCRLSLESTPDAGDCAPGWRCGREVRGQVCHPLDAGAPYTCSSDSDCEASWRCGPEGACVDVAAQGLSGTALIFSTQKVSPLLPTQVDLLHLRVLQVNEWYPNGTHRMVSTAEGILTVAALSAPLDGPHATFLGSTPLLRPARALVETEAHLLVTDSTGLMDYREAIDGGVPVLLAPGLANAELRYAPPFWRFGSLIQEELASFSGAKIALCGRETSLTSVCDPSTFQGATLPATINDIAFVNDGDGRRSALAATSAGLSFAPRANGSYLGLDGGVATAPAWRPVSLPGLGDACAATPAAIDRLASDPLLHALMATTDQDRQLWVFTRPSNTQNIAACGVLAFEPEYGPCAACGPGEVLFKLGTDEQSTVDDPVVVALCRRGEPDAGDTVVGYRHQSFDGGCSLDQVGLPLGVSRGYQVPQQTWGLQGLDSIGVPRRCPLAGCETMLSSTAPDRIAGGPAQLGTHTDDLIDGDGPHAQPSSVNSQFGLRLATYSNFYVAGTVTQNPDWMIGSTGRQGTAGGQTMAVQSMSRKLASSPADPIAPYALFNRSADLLPSAGPGSTLIDASGTRSFSTLTDDAEGRPWLIVGAGDRIWAEDARLVVEDGGVRSIDIKVVPLPSADIQSLAFGPFDRGDAGTGPLLEGYTVEQQRLFRVVVHSPTLWLSDELRLIQSNAVPVSVWLEGARGRVGTSDGRVFGLPVPVVLSTPIPEAPLPTVLNYGTLCGQAFALSASALYRLTLETPPLGTWKRVSLESAHPGVDGLGAHWGPAMHKAIVGKEEHLYLFSHTGLVIELGATCP